MRSPAAAIAWEFGARHRWGLSAVAGYLLVLGAVRLFVLAPGERVDFESELGFAFSVVVPLAAAVLYFQAVFTFGLSGDIVARQSIYPQRMFALPVTSAELAGWPMLYGTAAMALLWAGMRTVSLWPSDSTIPVIWPALLAAVFLAWTQALTWMPYPLRGLRVIASMGVLTLLDAVMFTALELRASEGVMLAILAPQLPLAYLTARYAVSRARRGDTPDWEPLFTSVRRLTGVLRPRRPFPSPARAQMWFEWRQYGRSLPLLVVFVLPCDLALLFLFSETPSIVFVVLASALVTPPFLATFVGATVAKTGSSGSDAYGVSSFLATRPMSSASLVAAKLKVAAGSALLAWLAVVVAVPLALQWSGAAPIVAGWWRRLAGAVGTPRAAAIVLLVLAVLLASTWKQLVQSLHIGMTGRVWLIKGRVFLALVLLAVAIPVVDWVLESKALMARLIHAFPSIAAVLVVLKLIAATRIAMRLRERGLLRDRTLIAGAICWDAVVFALFAAAAWVLPPVLLRESIVLLVAMLTVPLVRIAAAPLALAGNRHR